jgi:acyl carrier protein
MDHQVKLRGFRIELGEIEAALEEHPGVRDAVVVVREDAPGEQRLAGSVVAAEGGEVSAAELRAALKARLPEYMVPGAFVVLEALPLSPSGKTDRRALPAPEGTADEAYAAPRTVTEEILAGIWAEVLGVERVGVQDGFFELGGHSLLATRVVTRVRAALGVDLPLRVLFEEPTVAGLASYLDARRSNAGEALPPIERVASPGAWLPLSFAQQRLWTAHRLDTESRAYNQVLAFRLRGRVDIPALRRAVSELVRRHAVFRTRYVDSDGIPWQVIDAPGELELPVLDLSGVEDAEAMLGDVVRAEADAPFDLESGRLLRVQLVRLSETEHGFVAAMHHITNDGWSMSIIFREVAELYRAFTEGRGSPLAEPSIQYADFAAWQRKWFTPEREREQMAYWRTQLDALPELHLAADRARAAGGNEGETRPFALTPELSEGVRRLSRALGATPFMTLLAAFKVLLHWQGRGDQVVVGTDIANRNVRAEAEGLIGFFVNQLVLRTDLGGAPSFEDLVRRVREVTLSAYDHQDVPFERLVTALNPKRSAGQSPFFRVKVSMQNAPVAEVELPGVTMEPLRVERAGAALDLYLALQDTGGRMQGYFEYRTALFSRELMAAWTRRFRAVLELAVADPGCPLDGIRAHLDAEERGEQFGAQQALKAKRKALFQKR